MYCKSCVFQINIQICDCPKLRDIDVFAIKSLLIVHSQSETKLYNGSDKDVSASGGKLTKKESLKVSDLKSA